MAEMRTDGPADEIITPRETPKLTVSGVAAAINDLSVEIGEWSEGHGFRDSWLLADKLDHMAQAKGTYDHEQAEAEVLSRAANELRINVIGMKLMLTVSELSEGLETLRDHGVNIMAGEGNFGEELADAVIRLSDLAHMVKSPIGDEIIRKVDKNVDRPHKHGRVV